MKRLTKWLIAVSLACSALLTLNGCIRDVTTITDEDGFIYEARGTDTYAVFLDHLVDQWSIVVPAEFNGKPVVAVGTKNPPNLSLTRELTIPEGILVILPSAFSNWRALESIDLPQSLTKISMGAFTKCESLVNFTVPDSVTAIEARVFMDCSRLESIVISEHVRTIHITAFDGCDSLVTIEFVDNPWYSFQDGVLYDDEMETLILYLSSNQSDEYRIIDGVSKINASAFYQNEYLKHVIIPGEVEEVAESAFANCTALETVVFEAGVTTIGTYAFAWCVRLESVTLAEGIASIGEMAFLMCGSLTRIDLPASLSSIGTNAFGYCAALSQISVAPDSPNFISLENVLYSHNRETLVLYPNGKTDSSFTVSADVRVIKASAFEGNEYLTLVIISNGVVSIEHQAFAYCHAINTVFIPLSVTSIQSDAFYGYTDVIINCEAEAEPGSWNDQWAAEGQTVIWGYAYHP